MGIFLILVNNPFLAYNSFIICTTKKRLQNGGLFMNKYIKNLDRIEFVVTLACTGHCKHCSQGSHENQQEYIDAAKAASVVCDIASKYHISSVMSFGGEPLLFPETVYAINKAASEMDIPKRQLITNGFFSKDSTKIKTVARNLAKCGINDICISVDAFHQETILLGPVKEFAVEIRKLGIHLHTHPAWLASKEHDNPYNRRTNEILAEFQSIGITPSDGNIIVPHGNALKYLGSYYNLDKEYTSPYEENPEDIHAICISPDGSADILNGNINNTNILEILEKYTPPK